MKNLFLLLFFLLMLMFCHGQNENDSIRYYSMLNFIIENQSLINSYLAEVEEEKYDAKKLYIIQNDKGKIFCKPPGLYSQLRKYYKEQEEIELELAIRKDFVKYTFEEKPFNEEILKRMNNCLDSILRKGESVNTSQSYWSILFSDSFYDYVGVVIYNHNNKRRDINFAIKLEIVFLFDDQNEIKNTNICLLIP